MIHRLDLKTAQRLMNTKDFSLKAFLITSNLDFSPPHGVIINQTESACFNPGEGKKGEDTPRIVLAFEPHLTSRGGLGFVSTSPEKEGL